MQVTKRILLLLCAFMLVCTVAACAAKEPFDAGELLTPNALAGLKNEIAAGNTTPSDTTNTTPSDTTNTTPSDTTNATPSDTTKTEDEVGENTQAPSEPEAQTVYWLPNGSVYHSDSTCYHIKEKPNVQSGTVAAATEAGKNRLCSACAD